MANLALTGWAVLNSGAKLMAGANNLGQTISKILPKNLSLADKRRLKSLQRRIDCLIQPLNYCVILGKQMDSASQKVVENSKNLLYEITDFIHCFSLETEEGVSAEEFSNQLDYFIKELEFLCNSLNLTLSYHQIDLKEPPNTQTFSPSALLKASERVRSMEGSGGYLTLHTGSFYGMEVLKNGDDQVQYYKTLFEKAELSINFNHDIGVYTLEVINSDAFSHKENYNRYSLALNFADTFIISESSSLNIRVTRNSEKVLGSSTSSNSVHSFETLCWKIDESQSEKNTASGKSIKEVLEEKRSNRGRGLTFTKENVDAEEYEPREKESLIRGLNRYKRFSFVFDEINGQERTNSSEFCDKGSSNQLSDIDLWYLIKLCAYENELKPVESLDENDENSGQAFIKASDEELWRLLELDKEVVEEFVGQNPEEIYTGRA